MKKQSLHYYALDWDDNILFMPTLVYMEEKVGDNWIPRSLNSKEYASIRKNKGNWRPVNNNPQEAFIEFEEFSPRGTNAFLEDVIYAIENKMFGPSWSDFIECLVSGSIFAIITARGHKEESILKAIKWIIDFYLSDKQKYEMYNNLLKFAYLFKQGDYPKFFSGKLSENELVDKYLKRCHLRAVSSSEWRDSPLSIEERKIEALRDFKAKVNEFGKRLNVDVSIGFSDDDEHNIEAMKKFFNNVSKEKFPHIMRYVIKKTTNPDDVERMIKVVETSHQTPGLESSVMSFTSFNNMTNRLYPSGKYNRQDDFYNQHRREVEFLIKNAEDTIDVPEDKDLSDKEGKENKKKLSTRTKKRLKTISKKNTKSTKDLN